MVLGCTMYAFIALNIKPMLAEQAKQRQLATLKQNQKNDNTVPQNFGEREEQPDKLKINLLKFEENEKSANNRRCA